MHNFLEFSDVLLYEEKKILSSLKSAEGRILSGLLKQSWSKQLDLEFLTPRSYGFSPEYGFAGIWKANQRVSNVSVCVFASLPATEKKIK